MHVKLILAGGLAYYVVAFLLSLPSGALIHEGLLDATYRAHESFWRPELNQQPPDMAALLPMWIGFGLLWSFVFAALFGQFRGALAGAGWLKGVKFGAAMAALIIATYLSLHGVFALPLKVWLYWGGEGLVTMMIGGAVLGATAARLAPEPT